MRRGCIAITEISCTECKRPILHGERYLASDEEGTMNRLCLDCCLKKGLAGYQKERGQEYLTLFHEKTFAVPEAAKAAGKSEAKVEAKPTRKKSAAKEKAPQSKGGST